MINFSHSLRGAVIALGYAYLTTLPVLVGASFGLRFLDARRYGRTPAASVAHAASYGVGKRYADIAAYGYGTEFGPESSFAFFPLFPLIGRAVATTTGAAAGNSLWAVACVAFAVMFIAFKAYLRARFPDEPEENHDYALVALGLWPATFFFRFAYPEALFTLLAILVLLTIEQERPIWLSALVAGLASATRPVGIAMVLPVAMYAWSGDGGLTRRATRTAGAVLLACSGLIGFMAYQYNVCGTALQFVHAQSYWHVRPEIPLLRRAAALAWLEPMIDLYRPSSAIYWGMLEEHRVPPLSFLAANGPLFLAVVGGIALGAYRGWLTRYEVATSAGLLAIPYLTRAYEMGMSGQARFAAVAFPFYIVAGKILSALPRSKAAALFGLAGVSLTVYTSFVFAGFALR